MRHLAAIIPIGVLAVVAGAQTDSAALRTVERVIDGDAIVLDGGERVRLIGVDTPETVHPTKPVERFGRGRTVHGVQTGSPSSSTFLATWTLWTARTPVPG